MGQYQLCSNLLNFCIVHIYFVVNPVSKNVPVFEIPIQPSFQRVDVATFNTKT